MLQQHEARQRACALVERAMKAGADAADASYVGSASEAVQMRLGQLEDVERSEGEHVNLRAFVGQRSATIGTSDLSDEAADELANRVVQMAREAPEDRYAGLAPQDMLARGPFVDLDLIDESPVSPTELRDLALAAEDAARGVAGVTNSEGGTATAGRNMVALATSHGFDAGFTGSSRSLSATVVAGEGADKQRDYAWRQARHSDDLPSPDFIGKLAGERAVARLRPGRVRSGLMSVMLDPRVAGSILGHLISGISGPSITRRASFLLDRLDDQLFDSGVVVAEEPYRPRGLRSRPFDGEGLPVSPRTLVEGGRVTGWLLDSASARQLDLSPTGHASRGSGGSPGVSVSNVYLAAGSATPAELMSDIADGVYITELFGHGVNAVTGDYSRGASGFRIENGEVTSPIAEFTVAGNLVDMFAALTPANDLERYRGIDVPTVRIDRMSIAGD